MNIFIEFHSPDESLGLELIRVPKRFDRKAHLPADVILMKVHSRDVKKGGNMFLLSFGNKVAPSLLADWLYEKIIGRVTQFCMDRIAVPIDKNEIERVITEKIGKKESIKKKTTGI